MCHQKPMKVTSTSFYIFFSYVLLYVCIFHAGLTLTVLSQQISPCAIFVIIKDKNVKLTSILLHVLYLYIFVFVSPYVGGSIVPPAAGSSNSNSNSIFIALSRFMIQGREFLCYKPKCERLIGITPRYLTLCCWAL